MAIFFDAPVPPADLTTFVREVPLPSQLTLTARMGRRDLRTNYVDFAEIVRTNRTARFRTYDGRIHVSERDTGSEKRVRLLPLSSSLTLGEYERLQLEFARFGGTDVQALRDSIYDDGVNLARQAQYRLEQAWGDLLTDGILSINENGYQGTADFGVPSGLKKTAGTLWSDTTNSDPMGDITTWTDDYATNSTYGNGIRPASMMTSLAVLRLVQRNAKIIAAIYGAAAGRTLASLPDINALLASQGLPTFEAPYDTVVDVDGTSTRVIPDDRVVFFPPNESDLGYTAYGVSATALELQRLGQPLATAPGFVAVVDRSGPPYREQTLIDGVAMPILANARLLMVADVK